MLVSAGVIGMVLPGPGAPALVAGGLILWPKAFSKAERWFQRRFPGRIARGWGTSIAFSRTWSGDIPARPDRVPIKPSRNIPERIPSDRR